MNTEPFPYHSMAGRNAEIYLLANNEVRHSFIGKRFKLSHKRVSQICVNERNRREKAKKTEQLRSDFHKHNNITLKYALNDLLLMLICKPATRERLAIYFRTLGIENLSSLSVKQFVDVILPPVPSPEGLSPVFPILYQWGIGVIRIVEITNGILCLVPNGEFRDDVLSRIPVLCEYLETHTSTFPHAHYATENLLINRKSAIPSLSARYPLSYHAQKNAFRCLPMPL